MYRHIYRKIKHFFVNINDGYKVTRAKIKETPPSSQIALLKIITAFR